MVWLILMPLVLAFLIGGFPVLGMAQENDTIQPFADLKYTDDDNIFRSATDPESDVLLHLGVGVDVEVPVSRQAFNFRGKYEHVAYDKNDSLDHDDIAARLRWDWLVGDRFAGDLRADYLQTIGTFDEQATRTKDNRKDTGFGGSGVYQLTPRWDLIGTFDTNQHRVENRPTVDLDTTTVGGEVRYATGVKTQVGGRYAVSDGDYLSEEVVDGVPFDNDYTVHEVSGTFYWESTAKSELNLEVGYVEVERAQGDEFNYDGNLVRVSYIWDATGKTRAVVRLWNQAEGREEVTGYVVTQGISIRPSLSITSKLTASLDLLYEDVQHEGDSARTATGALREDTNQSVSLSVAYSMTRNFIGTFTYQTYDRESNDVDVPFAYNRWTAQLRATF